MTAHGDVIVHGVLVVLLLSGLLGLMLTKLAIWRTLRLNQPKPKPYAGINLAYRSSEDWLKVALATPDEGGCSRCGTYGPYDDVSAVYRGMQMCYWCAELERERARLIVEPK